MKFSFHPEAEAEFNYESRPDGSNNGSRTWRQTAESWFIKTFNKSGINRCKGTVIS
jgi:hypothetical protein